jgi:hypothetical protein
VHANEGATARHVDAGHHPRPANPRNPNGHHDHWQISEVKFNSDHHTQLPLIVGALQPRTSSMRKLSTHRPTPLAPRPVNTEELDQVKAGLRGGNSPRIPDGTPIPA